MLTSLTGRTVPENDPPDSAPRRWPRRSIGSILTLASTLALGIAMTVVAQPAHAVSSIDGQWTVSHGGTGHISLNANGTYTSTCKVYPNYKDAWCPAPSGTFQYSTMGSAGVTFTGADGSTAGYRVSGNVSKPDTIKSTFGSRTDSPLIMNRGTRFVCTDWGVRDGTPMAYTDVTGNFLYATGSHDFLGPVDRGNDIAETAPNYFQLGQCGNLYPKMTMASLLHIDTIRDATKAPTAKKWSPRATVTIHDLAETPVSGAKVSAGFTGTAAGFSCVTAADGTCTLGKFSLPNSISSTDFMVDSVDKAGSLFWQDPGDFMSPDARRLTIYNPLVGPPPPPPPLPPVTYNVSDLDAIAWTNSSPNLWEPQVTVTVSDSDGNISYGSIVTGTFSHHSGTVTCTTNGAGNCTVGNFILNRSTTSTEFTVTGVDPGDGSTYVPANNSDPDGDSNGTAITVKRP